MIANQGFLFDYPVFVIANHGRSPCQAQHISEGHRGVCVFTERLFAERALEASPEHTTILQIENKPLLKSFFRQCRHHLNIEHAVFDPNARDGAIAAWVNFTEFDV